MQIWIDKKGSVEVRGVANEERAWRVAEQLGITTFYLTDAHGKSLRGDQLADATITGIRERARILGHEVHEVDVLEPLPGTGNALSLPESAAPSAPTRRRQPKRHVNWGAVIGVPFLILVLLVVGVGSFLVIRDHQNVEFTTVDSFEEVLAQKNTPAQTSGTMREILNPDDSRYISMTLSHVDYLNGAAALVGSHYLRFQGLETGRVEDLFAGGAPRLRIDAGLGNANEVHVTEVRGPADELLAADVIIEVNSVTVISPPAAADFASDEKILFDDKATFQNLKQFTAVGFLEQTDEGFRLLSRGYNLALGDQDMDLGLRKLLNDTSLTPEESALFDAGLAAELSPNKRLVAFVEFGEMFPWSLKGEPLRRQITGEIGRARLIGVQLGAAYLPNIVTPPAS